MRRSIGDSSWDTVRRTLALTLPTSTGGSRQIAKHRIGQTTVVFTHVYEPLSLCQNRNICSTLMAVALVREGGAEGVMPPKILASSYKFAPPLIVHRKWPDYWKNCHVVKILYMLNVLHRVAGIITLVHCTVHEIGWMNLRRFEVRSKADCFRAVFA